MGVLFSWRLLVLLACATVLWYMPRQLRRRPSKIAHELVAATPVPQPQPALCPGLGMACDCPRSTSSWAATPTTRERVCARLQSPAVLFVGDSLMRDTWSAGALWLLMAELPPIRDCMFAAWPNAEAAIAAARRQGLLTEVLTPHASVSTFHVCDRRVRLVFRYGRLFVDLPAVREEARAQRAVGLVITHGILEMSEHGEAGVLPWASALARLGMPVVYLGAHSRIAALAPPEFADVAKGAQGNAALQRRTALVRSVADGRWLRVADAFNLTAELGPGYRDTVDGLHFGGWINLQRFLLALHVRWAA